MEQGRGNSAFSLILQGEIFGRYTADPAPRHPALPSITHPGNKTDGILDKRSGAVSVIQDLTGFQITPSAVFSFATSVIYEGKGHWSWPYLKWVPLEKADGLFTSLVWMMKSLYEAKPQKRYSDCNNTLIHGSISGGEWGEGTGGRGHSVSWYEGRSER